jgi:ABC-2 type transport system permease protein
VKSNIWLVAKHEIGRTLRQKSFWLFTLLMPAFFLALQVYYAVQDNDFQTGAQNTEAPAEVESPDIPVVGLVDGAQLISYIPRAIPPEMFATFLDEAAARAALEAGEIEQYVVIPADFLATGDVTVYDRDFVIRSGGEEMGIAFGSANQWMLRYLLEANLTGDEALVAVLRDPLPAALTEQHAVKPMVETDQGDRALSEVVASVMPYAYYFILIVVGGYLMRSVAAEKENRTAEVLLLSLNPRDLLAGKIAGLSAVAWLQLVVWLGAGLLLLDQGRSWLNAAALHFSPDFFVWAFLFLVFGYLLYASVMAAGAVIAPNAREAAKVTYLLIVPLMPTLMFGRVFAEEPHGTLALALSLFPFSAPSAMVTRLAVANVPIWQPVVSLAGLIVTAYVMLLLASRLFRADNLLSDEAFSWGRLATGWRE